MWMNRKAKKKQNKEAVRKKEQGSVGYMKEDTGEGSEGFACFEGSHVLDLAFSSKVDNQFTSFLLPYTQVL